MKKSLILLILPLLLAASCGKDRTPVLVEPSLEDLVIANCYTVRAAVEAFAAENNGGYPLQTTHRTPSGNNLFDLLPGGVLLENPFTQIRTEPTDGLASLPGQTAYSAVIGGLTAVGYAISGFGADSLIIVLSKLP